MAVGRRGVSGHGHLRRLACPPCERRCIIASAVLTKEAIANIVLPAAAFILSAHWSNEVTLVLASESATSIIAHAVQCMVAGASLCTLMSVRGGGPCPSG
jgi:hypothetical protein